MEVILLDKIENLGELGDKVQVKSGYARNYLIPFGKAKYANKENLAEFEQKRAQLEKEAKETLLAAQARKEKLQDATIKITTQVGEEGKLFGSIGTADIAHAMTENNMPIEKREIRLNDGALKIAGEYEIHIHLHADVDATINLVIEGEEQT